MVRAGARPQARVRGPVTPYEEAYVIRHEPPERAQRYHELAEKMDLGTLTPAERRELEALVEVSAQLMLENSRALLRHRDPDAYARLLVEEERRQRRSRERSARAGRSRAG